MNNPRRPKSTLPNDYLDDQIPQSSRATNEPREMVPRPNCTRATFHLPYNLLEECRDTVVALAGPPLRMTMAKLVCTSLKPRLKQLRDEFNNGERFPRRAGNLVGGRPVQAPHDE